MSHVLHQDIRAPVRKQFPNNPPDAVREAVTPNEPVIVPGRCTVNAERPLRHPDLSVHRIPRRAWTAATDAQGGIFHVVREVARP